MIVCLLILSFLPSYQVAAAPFFPDKYELGKECLQLVVVRYKGSSKGTLTFYQGERKESVLPNEIAEEAGAEEDVLIEEYTVWKKVFSTNAYLGKKGIGKKKEGDGKTPTGQFDMGPAFGILANPGSKMPYTKVNKYHYWCSDSGSACYNKLIRTDRTKHKCKGEHLINYKGSYDYGLFINYNEKGIKGKGSAIFLHCSKGRATAGCVAIPKSSMKKLLKALKPGKHPAIIIDRW